ncbi:hypothetical protein KPH14_012953 [Odynerus spinipes]|uniref:Uncharacterized protein n=1 Tax=Odynerus spinipes TaxID=1348599 RepID=A0AAD9R897_9HYME|nr:hypothetical protein KPH14_012953 [Odynerus spinipes]
MSDGTTRPTFKESENGIITLPISNNFTSCKVSTGNKAIQTLTTQGNTKILEISRQKIITDLKDPYFHTRPIKTKEYLSTITAGQAHFNHRANENKLLEPKFDNDLLVVE